MEDKQDKNNHYHSITYVKAPWWSMDKTSLKENEYVNIDQKSPIFLSYFSIYKWLLNCR